MIEDAGPVPTDQLLLLLAVAIIANVALMAGVLLVPLRDEAAAGDETPARPAPADVAVQVAARQQEIPEPEPGASGRIYDRVLRAVSYAFLGVAAAVVAASGLYPAAAPAIFLILALAVVFLVLVYDVLPPSVLGPARFVLLGSVAIAVVTVLIALTGGADSPFFFGYVLVVAAAALVVRATTAALAAAVASIVYLITLASQPGSSQLVFDDVVRIALNVLALWFVAYLASVVAREQRRTRDAALRLSLYDPLTQLYNRNYFFAVMDREIQRAARTGRRFCLLMLDMDDLKPINDDFGHHYGDRMLREVAEVVRVSIRGVDSAARYGGDEFVILLPETDPTGAFVVAEKLRESVSAIRISAPGRPLQTSVSVGVVAFPDDGATGDELLISADAAMYESKRRGKNRVAGRTHRPRTTVADPAAARRSREPAPAPADGAVMGPPAEEPAKRPRPRKPTARRGRTPPRDEPGRTTLRQVGPGRPEPASGPQAAGPAPQTGPAREPASVPAARPRRFPVVFGEEDVQDVMHLLLGPDRPVEERPADEDPLPPEASRRPA
jgi:diguanylate cyclase (GGDEF)-like protein